MRVGIIKVADFIDYQSYEIFNHVYVWLSSSEMFSQLTISLSLSGSSWISSLCLTIICKKYVKSAQSEDNPGGGCEAWIDIGEYEIFIIIIIFSKVKTQLSVRTWSDKFNTYPKNLFWQTTNLGIRFAFFAPSSVI